MLREIYTALSISILLSFLRKISRKLLSPAPRPPRESPGTLSLYAEPVNSTHAVWLAEIMPPGDDMSLLPAGLADDVAYICDNSHIRIFPEDGMPKYTDRLEISLACSTDRLSNIRTNRAVRIKLEATLKRILGEGNYSIK